jgi:hypothetical protein
MKKPSIILAVCLLACADTLIVPESGVDNFAPQPFELQGPSGVTKVCPSGKADNWGNCPAEDRKIVTIRASEDDEDDISVEFERGMREANNGGMLQLERGKVYVIGKKLDLGWLNDVYMQLEGEIKVRRC